MQTVLWAFGSMVVFMFIFLLLPLGFTKKGKFLVGLLAFLLALGGNAVAGSLPVGLIFLMLAVLAFLGAYLINTRFAAEVYQQQAHYSLVGSMTEEIDSQANNNEVTSDEDIVELDELDELDVKVPAYLDVKMETRQPINEIEEDIPIIPDLDLSENLHEGNDELDDKSELSESEPLPDDDSWLDELAELELINTSKTAPSNENETTPKKKVLLEK